MLTTFKQDEWKDPADLDHQIEVLKTSNPTPEQVRALFPYRGVARKRLIPYGIPEGAVIPYIRVKHEPSIYPFIGIIGVGDAMQWGTYPRRLILDSNEIQLIEA